MPKVQFFPVDIDYVTKAGGKAKVRIFGKTTDGKRVCVFDNNLEPYFWILPKENVNLANFRKKIEAINVKEAGRTAFVVKTELHDKKHLDKDVKAIKVIVNNPKDVPIIKDQIKIMRETEAKKEVDIPFYKRYLIDKEITPLCLCEADGRIVKANLDVDLVLDAKSVKQISEDLIKEPKILAFDIEVYFKGRLPIEGDPIIMIAFYGSDGFEKALTYKKFPTKKGFIEFVKDEASLIRRFKDIIAEQKPDYLISYYGDNFDFPYIRARASKFNIRLNLGLDKSVVRFGRHGQVSTAKIRGIPHIDLLKFIRRTFSESLETESYSLNNVANEILGEGKKEVDIEMLFECWDKNKELEKYCEYNLKDANLTLRLCEKILPNLNETIKLIGQPIFDVARMSYGQLVEWHLIKRAKEFNEICPNRPTYETIEKRKMHTYKGAFVFEPEPGFYKDVVFLDYRSLYPSVIVAKNISPGTLTKQSKGSNKSPEIELPSGKKMHYYFSYKKEGFIPSIVKDLIIRRNRIKEIIEEEEKTGRINPALRARDKSLKMLTNSIYGYHAFFGARYYSLQCAASITAWSRAYIQKTIEDVRKAGFKVIYADTDSVAFILGAKTEKDALNFLAETNRELPSLMELELENFYQRGIFVMKKAEIKGAKKKYALIDKDGNIKIVGFEAVRRDWSDVAKETQNKIFEIILKEGNIKKALNYVRTIIRKIKKKEVPISKLILETQLKKEVEDYEQIGPHVKVAQRIRQSGSYVGPGAIIRFVISEGEGMIRDRARLIEEIKEKEYDAEYYVNNQVIPAVERVFEVLGYDKTDLIGEQAKLGDFK